MLLATSLQAHSEIMSVLQEALAGLKGLSSKSIIELTTAIDVATGLSFSPPELEKARQRLSDLEVCTSLKSFLPYVGSQAERVRVCSLTLLTADSSAVVSRRWLSLV